MNLRRISAGIIGSGAIIGILFGASSEAFAADNSVHTSPVQAQTTQVGPIDTTKPIGPITPNQPIDRTKPVNPTAPTAPIDRTKPVNQVTPSSMTGSGPVGDQTKHSVPRILA